MQDPVVVRAVMKYVREEKPKDRLCLGDVFDMRPLRGKAGPDEQREGLRCDFDAGMRFLEEFRPTLLNWGNHDDRLWILAYSSRGWQAEYARDCVNRIEDFLRKIGCEFHYYDKRVAPQINGSRLRVVHGFASGKYASQRHAEFFGDCIVGHNHRFQRAVVGRVNGVATAHALGCVTYLDHAYNARMLGTLDFQNGFGSGWTDSRTGDYDVRFHIVKGTPRDTSKHPLDREAY